MPVPSGDAPTPRPAASAFPSHEGIHWHERGLPRTDQNWEIQPAGLARLLRHVSEEYAAPAGTRLYVTENGAAYDDEVEIEGGVQRVPDVRRLAFVRAHLDAVLDAIEEGVDVGGYFYWSLLDNFEWAWGYRKRFGLVRVDYATQRRTVKDSAIGYSRIIVERALPE